MLPALPSRPVQRRVDAGTALPIAGMRLRNQLRAQKTMHLFRGALLTNRKAALGRGQADLYPERRQIPRDFRRQRRLPAYGERARADDGPQGEGKAGRADTSYRRRHFPHQRTSWFATATAD